MTSAISIESSPERIFLERGIFQQSMNCEFRFRTDSQETWTLQEMTTEGFDDQNRLLFRLPLNNFGLVPPILIVPERHVAHSETLEIFNPLPNFPLDYPIHKLDYEFRFSNEKGDQTISKLSLTPLIYDQETVLILPFKGTSLVTEGHDFLTHHRRNFPFTHPLIQQIGIKGNNSRFAYDFVLLDDNLTMFKDTPHGNEDFFCWAKPVLCPGEGKIVSMENDMPDNDFFKPPAFDVESHIREPETSMLKHLGNHVMVDHGNDEFSVLGHMLKGSIRAKLGDMVGRGDVVGQVGTSGDSFSPHIHYQVQDGKSMLKSEGLPSKFQRFDLLIGDVKRRIENSCPNTGMVIRFE